MDGAAAAIEAGAAEAVRTAAEAYCVALHRGDAAALGVLFDARAHLYGVDAGAVVDLPRDAWLDRVAGREKPPADVLPDYVVETVDVSGPETALVRLSVSVGPRRFTDYLNFLKVDGSWRVIAKIYRLHPAPAAGSGEGG